MIVLIKYSGIISEFQKSYILNFTIRVNSSDETPKWNGRGKLHVPKKHALDGKKIEYGIKLISVEMGLR